MSSNTNRSAEQGFTLRSWTGTGAARIPGLNFQPTAEQIQTALDYVARQYPNELAACEHFVSRQRAIPTEVRAVVWSALYTAFTAQRDAGTQDQE